MSSTQPPTFESLGLDPRVLEVLTALGYENPTPIQAEAIPAMLEGHDVIGRARTGSGKTAAYGLPLLHALRSGADGVRALILAPTRELALQITESLRAYAKKLPIRIATIYGGAPYPPQLAALSSGVPVVVGTPGRLIDHLERGSLDLSALQLLVLDEADEMLRMGFIEDVERILAATPEARQIALFSATMPAPIRKIADKYLRAPKTIQVEKEALTTTHINQRWVSVPERFKREALVRILASEERDGTLVFARTKAECADCATWLAERGLSVDALHGDLSQSARELVLTRLRARRVDVLIATDVAARGIDVEHLTHVINLDLPNDPESYVHRIGRTGRAGRAGAAISLVTPREVGRLRRFQSTLGVRMEAMLVPSDAEIRHRARARLAGRVQTALEGEIPDALKKLAREMLEEASADDVLGATLMLLARDAGDDFRGAVDEEPPLWARPKPDRPKKERPERIRGRRGGDDLDHVELFLPTGSLRGLRPKDLVGALANELGIPVGAVGRITIQPHKTFFSVPREIADHLLTEHGALPLRGQRVPLSPARPRVDRPVPRRPPRGARPAGPPRPGKRKGRRGDR